MLAIELHHIIIYISWGEFTMSSLRHRRPIFPFVGGIHDVTRLPEVLAMREHSRFVLLAVPASNEYP